MDKHLKILLLEDSEYDADLIQLTLKRSGINFTPLVVDTKTEFINGLRDFNPDLILSDHSLPQFNSAEALKIYQGHLKEQERFAPFILVTGTVSEEFAVQCIKDGADDYILKDRLQRLPAAIENSLEKCTIKNENQKVINEKKVLLERYEYVAKASSEAIWDWDIVNQLNYCGQGFEKIFGHAVNSTSANNAVNTTYIGIEDIERVVTSLEGALKSSRNSWNNHYKYLKGDGEYAFVEDKAVIIRNGAGEAIRMIGVMKDITHRKKEELRLKLLESVITHITDAVLIAEADCLNPVALTIVYINEAFTKMTGYTREEAMDNTPRILQGPKTNRTTVERLRIAFEENEACHVEMVSYKKSGEEFWAHFSVTPIADTDGKFTHWVFIERDITEQKNYIKEIEEQNLQLKEIAWMQSHNVRSPLARMMGFINLIKFKQNAEIDNRVLLTFVLEAAVELDAILRKIVEKSEKLNTADK